MTYLKNLFVVTAALGLLSACAGMEYYSAQKASPTGSEFSKSLYGGYLGLSKDEFDESDFEDSDVFAMRAKASAAGNAPAPEEISARNLPADKVGELTAARGRLMAAFGRGGRDSAPAPAAHAQVMFDCWMQEQEENFQPDDIARCRAGFMSSIAQVEAALKPQMAEAPKPAPAPAPAAPMAKPAEPQKFIVFFDFNSATVTPTGASTIQAAAEAAKKMNAGRVAVLGHADRSGTTRYNLGLSQRRADAVVAALTGRGISGGTIGSGAMGESVPLVPTDDGVRNPENRRVEITILAN